MEIPGYQVQRALGKGGIGAVYLASPEGIPEAERAVKVLHTPDESQRLRLQREGELLARVQHPNLVRVHDLGGLSGGRLFLVMEFVEGEDLGEVLRREEQVPWTRAADWGLQAARGLACLHAAGVVHRDVKPDNMILDAAGRVRVTDLGLGRSADLEKLTVTGAILGTPLYVAPEQALGWAKVSGASDVYALGVTLYEFCTGKVPLEGDCLPRQLYLLMDEMPQPLRQQAEVPGAFDALVMQMLAKDPEDRPSMQEVAERLEALLTQPEQAAPQGALIAASLAALAALALVVGALAFWAGGSPAETPAPASPSPTPGSLGPSPAPSSEQSQVRVIQRGGLRLEAIRVSPTLWMARRETTWAMWAIFEQEGGGPKLQRSMLYPSEPDCPVVNMTYADALSFCRWIGGRLPTYAEWRAAATNGERTRWPWGDEPPLAPPARLNFSGGEESVVSTDATPAFDGHAYAAASGSFAAGANQAGILDLCGNVAEWSATRGGEGRRVLGGHFLAGPLTCAPQSEPLGVPESKRAHHVGFRVVFDAE